MNMIIVECPACGRELRTDANRIHLENSNGDLKLADGDSFKLICGNLSCHVTIEVEVNMDWEEEPEEDEEDEEKEEEEEDAEEEEGV